MELPFSIQAVARSLRWLASAAAHRRPLVHVTSCQEIVDLRLCQHAPALIPFQNGRDGAWIMIVLLPAPQSLCQQTVDLNTLNPQQQQRPGPRVLDGKAAIDPRALAQPTSRRRLIPRAERDDAVTRLSKRAQRADTPSSIGGGEGF